MAKRELDTGNKDARVLRADEVSWTLERGYEVLERQGLDLKGKTTKDIDAVPGPVGQPKFTTAIKRAVETRQNVVIGYPQGLGLEGLVADELRKADQAHRKATNQEQGSQGTDIVVAFYQDNVHFNAMVFASGEGGSFKSTVDTLLESIPHFQSAVTTSPEYVTAMQEESTAILSAQQNIQAAQAQYDQAVADLNVKKTEMEAAGIKFQTHQNKSISPIMTPDPSDDEVTRKKKEQLHAEWLPLADMVNLAHEMGQQAQMQAMGDSEEWTKKRRKVQASLVGKTVAQQLAGIRQQYAGNEAVEEHLDYIAKDLGIKGAVSEDSKIFQLVSAVADKEIAQAMGALGQTGGAGGLMALMGGGAAAQPQGPPVDPVDEILKRYRVKVVQESEESGDALHIVEIDDHSIGNLVGSIVQKNKPTPYGPVPIIDADSAKLGTLFEAKGGVLIVDLLKLARGNALDTYIDAVESGKVNIKTPTDMIYRLGLSEAEMDGIPIDDVQHVLMVPEPFYTQFRNAEGNPLHSFIEEEFPIKVRGKGSGKLDDVMKDLVAYVAHVQQEEGLKPIEGDAVVRVVQELTRRAERRQEEIALDFGWVSSILEAADARAASSGSETISLQDIDQLIKDDHYLWDDYQRLFDEHAELGFNPVNVSAEPEPGQMAGLAVMRIDGKMFGSPSRIVAKTYVGKEIKDIMMNADVAGSVYKMGKETIETRIRDLYGQERVPLFGASIKMLGVKNGVDGDSASGVEYCTLVSQLAELPLSRRIAMTGAIEPTDEHTAIGGVRAKIEGWYRHLKSQEALGYQALGPGAGVIIPEVNTQDLMLADEIAQEIQHGNFTIWSIKNEDAALEILVRNGAQDLISRSRTGSLELDEDRLAQLETYTTIKAGAPDQPGTIHGMAYARVNEYTDKFLSQNSPAGDAGKEKKKGLFGKK